MSMFLVTWALLETRTVELQQPGPTAALMPLVAKAATAARRRRGTLRLTLVIVVLPNEAM